jgi:hypothetical protein
LVGHSTTATTTSVTGTAAATSTNDKEVDA